MPTMSSIDYRVVRVYQNNTPDVLLQDLVGSLFAALDVLAIRKLVTGVGGR